MFATATTISPNYSETACCDSVLNLKSTTVSSYLIGSDKKQRPHARRAFCHRLRAAMALLNVTGIGLSPRWNLQNGTRPACVKRKRFKKRESNKTHKNEPIVHLFFPLFCVLLCFTSLNASLNSPPGAMPSCSVMWAETLSRRICIRPDISPFWQTQMAEISIRKSTDMPSVVTLQIWVFKCTDSTTHSLVLCTYNNTEPRRLTHKCRTDRKLFSDK